MVLFAIELIISCIAVDDYFLNFFFWLDIISLLTILLDIHWFYNFFVNFRKRRIKNMKLYKDEPVKNKVWKDFIADDEDFAFMRNSLDKKFYALYNQAFDEFQFGDWNKAKEFFEQILYANDDDGPSQ